MKRILSLLVVFAMVIAMVPSVFAAKTEIDMDELLGVLEIIENIEQIDVALAEGARAKTYKWTPAEDGLLTIYVYEIPEGTELSITMTQGDKSVTYNTEDAFELEVEANAEVSISVVKTSEAAVEFTMSGMMQAPRGSQENPIVLPELENEVKVTAEPTWFQGFFNGTTMTVTGTGDYTLNVNGETVAAVDGVVTMDVVTPFPMMPFVFAIDKAGDYTVKFEYPLGSYMNPEILFRPQFIMVDIAEGNDQGYYYKWTATDAGTLKLTCPTVEGVEYDVILTSNSNYEMAWLSDSEDGTVSIATKAGDEILIQVVAAPNMETWVYPALQTNITGEFIYEIGHQQNPEILFRPNQIAVNVAEGNNQGYYYKWTSNADGELKLTCPEVEGVEYDVVLTNMTTYENAWLQDSEDGTVSMAVKAGDELIIQVVAVPDAEFNYPALQTTLTGEFIFPVGSQENPAELVVGENTAEIAAGSQGYFYTWTAAADGELTITMPEGNWTYVINNLTAGVYGEIQTSDSETAQKSVTIEAKAGEEYQLIVNTYNPEDMFANPAGTLVVTAEFEAPYIVGDVDGNEDVSIDDAIYLLQHVLMPDQFPVEQPADYDKSGDVGIDDAIYLLQHVLMPDQFPLN